MDKRSKKLEILNRQIKVCVKCRLAKTRNLAVPGEGPLSAEFMFLGQGPGVEEDKTGRPFIGRAGRLLGELLASAGIERKKVFITSAVKCFPTPPPNRKPKKDELAACFNYLERQIAFIKPQKIVLMGNVAFQLFFPKKKSKDYRGKWMKKGDRNFFVTYHPAAGVRFQKFKKILKSDFANFKKEF